MICPKCGLEQAEAGACAKCGVVVSKYKPHSAAPGEPGTTAKAAEVYGHSYYGSNSPINKIALPQPALTSPAMDFGLYNQLLPFWCPQNNAIYVLDDGSNLIQTITGDGSLTPQTLGAKGGIDLFSRTYKTCLALADADNQRIIEWELDPSTWPGNPGEVFSNMLSLLEKQNISGALQLFTQSSKIKFFSVFEPKFNSLPDFVNRLKNNPFAPIKFEHGTAIYTMYLNLPDENGEMQNVLSDVEFYQTEEGKWLINKM